MPVGSPRSPITLERITEVCERFYTRDGFVKWSDVGAALGISRQAVQLRLRAAIDRGDLTPETVERWQSMTSRAAITRERREKSEADRKKNQLRIQLTPENHQWLLEECAFRRCKTVDFVNGLLTREREAAAQQS